MIKKGNLLSLNYIIYSKLNRNDICILFVDIHTTSLSLKDKQKLAV